MRKLVVGDIHGALIALIQCLTRCSYDYTKDKLIFLGDYVDGWSHSSELIQYLIDIDKKAKYGTVFLRGNHDKWCEEWLLRGQSPSMWVEQGAKTTIDSYIRTGLLADEEHRAFFRKLHNYYIDEDNNGFVHGGFISRKGLGHEKYQADYYWDRDLWNLALMSHGNKDLKNDVPPKYTRFLKHKEVFIGHTATTNWKCKPHYPEYVIEKNNKQITIPMNRCNVWNLDTGAGHSGKLTIMDIDTKEYWQSDYSSDLYPGEMGR